MDSTSFSHNLPINWVEGMMVGREHLKEINDLIVGSARNSLVPVINPINYGLLPCYNEGDTSFEFDDLKGDNPTTSDYFTVSLKKCVAVTRDPQPIFIAPETINNAKYNENKLECSIRVESIKEELILIYLRINHDRYVKVGKINNDSIRREPYLNLEVELMYMGINELDEIPNKYEKESSLFPLAVYRKKKNSFGVDSEDYIPPCMNFHSHPLLLEKLDRIRTKTHKLFTLSNSAIRKGEHHDGKSISAVTLLAKSIISPLCSIIPYLDTTLEYGPPIHILRAYQNLILSLRSLNDSKKDLPSKMLTEINKHLEDRGLSSLNTILNKFKETKYNHFNINATITGIESFIDSLIKTMTVDYSTHNHNTNTRTEKTLAEDNSQQTKEPTVQVAENKSGSKFGVIE